MAPATYEIDPDADTNIHLKNPTIVFAPWDNEECDQKIGGVSCESDKAESTSSEESHAASIPEGEAQSLNEDVHSTRVPIFSGFAADTALPEDEVTNFRVSSRHLTLASPWFKRTLTKAKWSECERSGEDGLYHITAEDWDIEAFKIVLDIIHLRNYQVPRKVTLEMLAQIAVIVDYYECDEAMVLFTTLWIDSLSETLPRYYCRDVVLWVWVAWVFRLEHKFKQATGIAVSKGTETMRTLDLPIPGRIVDGINSRRCQAIEAIIDRLHHLLEDFCKDDYECPSNREFSFQCSSFLFGSLSKELRKAALTTPRPTSPFAGRNYQGLCNNLHSIKSPMWYGTSNSTYHRSPHPCNLESMVKGTIKETTPKWKGWTWRIF